VSTHIDSRTDRAQISFCSGRKLGHLIIARAPYDRANPYRTLAMLSATVLGQLRRPKVAVITARGPVKFKATYVPPEEVK